MDKELAGDDYNFCLKLLQSQAIDGLEDFIKFCQRVPVSINNVPTELQSLNEHRAYLRASSP